MSEIHFLNIDLDIESTEDISPIVQEWGDKISIHRNDEVEGIFYGSFETWSSEENEIISNYIDLVSGLSPSARKVWNGATKREFDFGYESGTEPNNFHSRISSESIVKLAEVGGSVAITIYPLTNT